MALAQQEEAGLQSLVATQQALATAISLKNRPSSFLILSLSHHPRRRRRRRTRHVLSPSDAGLSRHVDRDNPPRGSLLQRATSQVHLLPQSIYYGRWYLGRHSAGHAGVLLEFERVDDVL